MDEYQLNIDGIADAIDLSPAEVRGMGLMDSACPGLFVTPSHGHPL